MYLLFVGAQGGGGLMGPSKKTIFPAKFCVEYYTVHKLKSTIFETKYENKLFRFKMAAK